jgi:trans-aconitate methyltransferase
MVKQARRRNAASVRSGRLTLVHGNMNAIKAFHPVDLIVAVNVLYFWRDPHTELQKVRDALGPKGVVALSYQLRRNLPVRVQEAFPLAGYRLYDTDDEIKTLLRDAGFGRVDSMTRGPHRMHVAFE